MDLCGGYVHTHDECSLSFEVNMSTHSEPYDLPSQDYSADHGVQSQTFIKNKFVTQWNEVRLTRLEQEINEVCQRQDNAERHPLKQELVKPYGVSISPSDILLPNSSLALNNLLEDVIQSRDAVEKLNNQLRESEQRYRTFFESTEEGSCILEKIENVADSLTDFVYIEGNPAFAAYTGLSHFVGKTVRQVSMNGLSDEQECLLIYDEVCRTGQSIKFELRVVAQGRVLELHVFRIEDSTHQRIGIKLTDITQRHRADQLLRQNHNTFFNLIEIAPFGLYVVDAQFRLLQASTASQKVFRNIEPLIGRDFEEIIRILWPETFANEVLTQFRHTLETGLPCTTKNTIQQRKNTPEIEAYDWKIARITLPDGQYGVICYFYEISEHQQAADELRESEAFSRSIIKSSTDCIKVLDLEGNLLSMENGKVQLVVDGAKLSLNTSWLDFWTGEDRLSALTAVKLAAAGEMGHFVGFLETLVGQATWWDVVVSPIFDASGKPDRLLVISRDVTQRHQAENVLQQRTAQFETLLNEAPIGILLIDGDFCIGQANPVARHVWPTIANLMSCHFDKLLSLLWPQALADEIINQCRCTVQTGKPFAIAEIAQERIDQQGKDYYEWQINRIPLPDGRHGLVCYFRDISERVLTQKTMRESEERYRSLFNAIDEGFALIEILFDASGHAHDYRFLEANPAFAKQTGLSDPSGKLISQITDSEEMVGIDIYAQVLRTGEAVRFTYTSKRLGRWFDVSAARLDGPGSCKVVVVFNDVTERKQSERRLMEQAEALAHQDRLKDEFLAMLSHELRNPLAPISNAMHLLRLQKNDDPVSQQARVIIERQFKQLNRLVDDLLEVSRITTGRIQLRREQITVRGIVERAIEATQPLIVQRRHELQVSLPAEPIFLHADASRLEQVLVNLLTNSAKYSDEGSRIVLSAEKQGDQAVLRVRDSGIGIAPELLPRIFDLFTQADRSLDRSQGGLGIGLNLVQRLVELHGGSVKVQSVLGQGSEFVVSLPLILTPIPLMLPVCAAAHPPVAGHGCHILVVDDNVDAARTLAALLEESGHEVKLAFNGYSALEETINYRPDVVLMDIGLPGINGYEVAQQIRQQESLKNVTLVALTGYGQQSDLQHSIAAGFDHHLVKPAEFDKIEQLLAALPTKRESRAIQSANLTER